MRHYQTSASPFYDKEFAATPIRKEGQRILHTTPAAGRYSTNISCRDCTAAARIETFPSKIIYRCIACQALLATITPHAEVHTP